MTAKRPGASRETALVDTNNTRCFVGQFQGKLFITVGLDCEFDDEMPERDSACSFLISDEHRDLLVHALIGDHLEKIEAELRQVREEVSTYQAEVSRLRTELDSQTGVVG